MFSLESHNLIESETGIDHQSTDGIVSESGITRRVKGCQETLYLAVGKYINDLVSCFGQPKTVTQILVDKIRLIEPLNIGSVPSDITLDANRAQSLISEREVKLLTDGKRDLIDVSKLQLVGKRAEPPEDEIVILDCLSTIASTTLIQDKLLDGL